MGNYLSETGNYLRFGSILLAHSYIELRVVVPLCAYSPPCSHSIKLQHSMHPFGTWISAPEESMCSNKPGFTYSANEDHCTREGCAHQKEKKNSAGSNVNRRGTTSMDLKDSLMLYWGFFYSSFEHRAVSVS